jgi:hypothetical protein
MAGIPVACLDALSALERRFDGPVPECLREATLLGLALPARLRAEAQVSFFSSLIHGQIAIIRQRRGDGTFYPELISDLGFYRDRRRIWREELLRLRRIERPQGAKKSWYERAISPEISR